jgi:putative heme iron utilization protein
VKHHGHSSSGHKHHTEPLYDTEVPTPSHAERARTLVEHVGTGTLSTAAAELDGHPYGSFVTYGLENGQPVFLISALAEHTKNMLGEPRCSLMVVEPGQGDPLARGRVTLVARATRLEKGDESAAAREAFLAAHPGASYYVDYGDFRFWRATVEKVRYIGGYGRMSWIEAEEWAASTPDPIAPHAKRILDHMNNDHAEAMTLYCKAFTKAQEFSTVSMTCVDRYGFEMSVRTDQGPRPIRLPFASAITTADEARVELVRLAKQAREQLGA